MLTDDGRVTDAGVTGILLAHQWAFRSGELKIHHIGIFTEQYYLDSWPQGYKTFFMLNSIEHENSTSHKT